MMSNSRGLIHTVVHYEMRFGETTIYCIDRAYVRRYNTFGFGLLSEPLDQEKGGTIWADILELTGSAGKPALS